ncbi:MAG TPA: single-stranded DNA-binding protein [Mycobacteriales bacterium]
MPPRGARKHSGASPPGGGHVRKESCVERNVRDRGGQPGRRPQAPHPGGRPGPGSFRIASTSRRFDRDSQRWIDSAQLFLGVTCWRELAGNAAASLRRGDPVIVSGKLSTRTYEKDGQNRSVCELEALAVGPDLARGTAVFRRTPRSAEEPAGATADPAAEESLLGAGV